MIFITVLLIAIVALLAFAFTEPKGKHTTDARTAPLTEMSVVMPRASEPAKPTVSGNHLNVSATPQHDQREVA